MTENLNNLSRFIFNKSRINWDKMVVKTTLFTDNQPEGFSVFLIDGLNDKEIWNIAEINVVPSYPPDKPLQGRCDLYQNYYENVGLKIKKDEPPARHHLIFGMPVPNESYDEAKILTKRQYLIQNSKFFVYSN